MPAVVEDKIGLEKTKTVKMKGRGRPPKKNRGRPRKRGRPSKKRTTSKKADAPIQVPAVCSESKKRLIPTSLFNLILFTMIFGVIVLAHFALEREREKRIPVVVSTIEITPEEDVMPPDLESPEIEIPENIAEAPQVEKVEEAEKVVEVEMPAKVVVKPKKKSASPYNSGGTLDLDAPAARNKYLEKSRSNIAKLSGIHHERASSKDKKIEGFSVTPPPQESYTGKSNPWNSGGAEDLDHPINYKKRIDELRANRGL